MTIDIKVLVVDDDEPVRNSLVNFLEDEGFEPVSAESGEQALDLAAKEHFDVAIVDMRLPGIDGDTVVLEAKKIQSHLKFIIYTGSDDYYPQNILIDIGMKPEHVFYKPLRNLDVLSQAIRSLMAE
ncbi:Response regulator receiver domain-containing protein [Desulfatibacillum alkenivorans DSM 16219]|jgi:DNA-binding NtrC family response regulator|uniref:Response regulator receiver domain-containing protein n=1 Tax=Desulfatibacillum alkenivorans DSM 16219 TaxID=1121393 RepID=A0A1M6U238_9BACT|nr:response regulator [Desulfatibacillum alkenivorans]SHK63220.1 Response regulator receiver domain-containing protein [Desulfatibacillum alkenivorans DSM 16219]